MLSTNLWEHIRQTTSIMYKSIPFIGLLSKYYVYSTTLIEQIIYIYNIYILSWVIERDFHIYNKNVHNCKRHKKEKAIVLARTAVGVALCRKITRTMAARFCAFVSWNEEN